MWKSIVFWPKEVSLGNSENKSEDTHETQGHAEAVCRGIKRDGLGGEGKIFPISTAVEEVK